jgi:hypothetical protein
LGRLLSNPILGPKLRVLFQSIASEDAGPVSMTDLGRSSQQEFSLPTASGLVSSLYSFGSGSSSLQVPGRQGQNGTSTADLGCLLSRSSHRRQVLGWFRACLLFWFLLRPLCLVAPILSLYLRRPLLSCPFLSPSLLRWLHRRFKRFLLLGLVFSVDMVLMLPPCLAALGSSLVLSTARHVT